MTTNASSILDDMTPFALIHQAASHEQDDTDEKTEYKGFHEEHLILRLPPALKDRFRTAMKEGTLEQDFAMQFHGERHGFVYFKDEKYLATLVNLPTITESYKSLDKKQFYKIADICQMVLVSPMDDQHETLASNDPNYPHGLTPPMIYVRKRRFRKPAVKHQYGNSVEDVERQVAKLIEADMRAMRVSHAWKRPEELLAEQQDVQAGPVHLPGEEHADETFFGQHDVDDVDALFEESEGYVMQEEPEDSDDSDLAAEIEFSLLDD